MTGADRDIVARRTIEDFGAQWTRYPDNDGYYASVTMLADILAPFTTPDELRGARVAEIGSGSGRIVNMLLDAGAAHVVALEPSAAMEALRRNISDRGDRVTCVQAPGEQLPLGHFDAVLSIGVLHHIVDPAPVVRRAYESLKPGGRFIAWIYGREGNRLYLALATPLRWITRRLPDFLLAALAHMLVVPLSLYVFLCHFLPLPMRDYMRRVIGRYGWRHRFLTVFDQLNPAYARYYSEAEARALLEQAGFVNVRLRHRHGYSWTVAGERPA
jgi:SAM-dependent methyltransferase